MIRYTLAIQLAERKRRIFLVLSSDKAFFIWLHTTMMRLLCYSTLVESMKKSSTYNYVTLRLLKRLSNILEKVDGAFMGPNGIILIWKDTNLQLSTVFSRTLPDYIICQ